MNKHWLACAVACSALSAPVSAAVTIIDFAPGGVPGGDPGAFAGETVKFNFGVGAPDLTGLSGSYTVFPTPSGTGQSAPPAGSPNGNYYLSVANPAQTGSAELLLGGRYETVSFYWGSIDRYNKVTLYEHDGSETVIGPDDLTNFLNTEPVWGNQQVAGANIRFQFKSSGSGINKLKFDADGFAFELDDVAVGDAVPEPATWAMLIGGFGLTGFAARRKRLHRSVLA